MSFQELTDLASARLGARALAANDEFFAPKENLLKPEKAVFIPERYTDRGKWMDGWETRRRRSPGYDWVLIRLARRGVLRGVNVDTSHFLGNFPESCSIDACDVPGEPSLKALGGGKVVWAEILPKSPLKGGGENLFPIDAKAAFTHLRLNIFPDGGVARLRVHGEVVPDLARLSSSRRLVDLAAAENGGLVLAGSDMFFGPRNNLILPGPSKGMWDGWETKRRRGSGHDWVILRLGMAGRVERAEVDTSHFKGNAPDSCMLESCYARGTSLEKLTGKEMTWGELLPKSKLKPHRRHTFEKELRSAGTITHVRLNIYPDGGVARLRLYGRPGAH